MLGTFIVSSVASWYYLKTKRKDLDKNQKLYLTACGLGYASQVALKLFYIQNNRPVPLEEVLTFVFAAPMFYGLAVFFAKPAKGSYVQQSYIAGALTYALGLYIEVKAEFDRKVFKQDPLNKGRLYMEGWNAWTRNPNYFGELLLFAGWNMFTFNNSLLCLEALGMTASFYLGHIPEKEAYLSTKYSADWSHYSKNVKALIPFVH